MTRGSSKNTDITRQMTLAKGTKQLKTRRQTTSQ